jgi:hypothetical protein
VSEARVGHRPGAAGAIRGVDRGAPHGGIGCAFRASAFGDRRRRHALEAATEGATAQLAAQPLEDLRGTAGAPARPLGRRVIAQCAGQARRIGFGTSGHGCELEAVEVVAGLPQALEPLSRGRRRADRIVVLQGQLDQADMDRPGELRIPHRLDEHPALLEQGSGLRRTTAAHQERSRHGEDADPGHAGDLGRQEVVEGPLGEIPATEID